MGQRLNLEITKNGRVLANAYYHWSGYTSSSFRLTSIILSNLENVHHEDDVIRSIRLLETTGALLSDDEMKAMNQHILQHNLNLLHFKQAVSRNKGLISFTRQGIEETRKWEEARVEIDIDNKEVIFSVYDEMLEEVYCEDYEKTQKEYEALPFMHFPNDSISFDDFPNFYEKCMALIEDDHYYVRTEDGNVIAFIE